MPIISSRGINTPATYLRNFVTFLRVGEIRREWDNNRFTALVSKRVPAQMSLQLLPLQLLEVIRIQRKIIWMILTSTKKFIKLPEVGGQDTYLM
jgi:hypothetical protein